MGHFQAVFYRDPAGFEPVRDFVAPPDQMDRGHARQASSRDALICRDPSVRIA